ncbi:MAG: peptidoglycan DD-metalloendopeptidase family protein [Alphaproteobacteria bacterium]|nr:peptidoglycan DD-metalloendopeptidase family protein [Alphaproteobacteria bacterium]
MIRFDKIRHMNSKRFILIGIFIGFILKPGYSNDELIKIQHQIKQTEQQNKKIEQQLQTSAKDVEQTKKQLVKAADKVSDLEEQRSALARRIAELDKQRDKISAELSRSYDGVVDSTASILFIASNPNFDAKTMHDYVLTSVMLTAAADRFDTQIMDATQKMQELDKIRNNRAIEKEKLDRSAKKYSSEKDALDKLLKTRSAQNEKLKNQQIALQEKLKKLSLRAKNISELSAGVGSSEMSSDTRFSTRKLNTPVRGKLVVKYGEKTALGLKSDGWRIRTHGNALVMAPADGIVKFADSFRGFGKVIIMSHKNGYNTVITNMGSIDALVGQEILAGEPIGRMNENRPEMYLEVRRGDKSVDPARLFNEP